MGSLIKTEVSKIIDAYNGRKIKFILCYGVLKAMMTTLIICLLFALLGDPNEDVLVFLANIGIKVVVSIIPGISWGILDYYMYKDIVEEREKFRINSVWYVILYGVLGWGLICSTCNIIFIPFNVRSVVSALVALPIYGIVLGIVSKKLFNKKLIKQIFDEYIKGKNITGVKVKNNKIDVKTK